LEKALLKKTLFNLALLGFLAACGGAAPHAPSPRERGGYESIPPGDAKAMMDNAEAFILLDVRTLEEFTELRIPCAILIPDYEIAQRAEAELPDKNALILVYCRSGRRSKDASQILAELGYTNVWEIGGIIDWPYETEGERGH
jgi:rhodanese-related sulfurtransferase